MVDARRLCPTCLEPVEQCTLRHRAAGAGVLVPPGAALAAPEFVDPELVVLKPPVIRLVREGTGEVVEPARVAS